MKTRKVTIKLLAFVMAFIMTVLTLPISAFANMINTNIDDISTDIDSEIAETEQKDIIVLEEDKSLRDEKTKHFKLSDGTTKAVVYPQAVHYKDADGNWVDIDNALTLNGSEYSSNNKSEIKFTNKSGSNGLVSIKDGDYKIDFTPLNTNKVSVVIENPQSNNSRKFEDMSVLNNLVSKAIYEEIYDGIDIEYILVGNNIKENIIVKEKQDSYTFTFELKLNNLSAELKDGAIIMSDYDSGEQVYEIPAPYMLDANNVYSESVEYSLVQNSKWKYTFTVTADAEWINSDDRAFPVTIDPTISDSSDFVTSVIIKSIGVNFPNSGIIGADTDTITYIKDTQLPYLPKDAYITDATISLKHYGGTNSIVGIYKINSDWDETIRWTDIVDSHGNYNLTGPLDYNYIAESNETDWYSWNIKNAVNHWYYYPNQNYGIAIALVAGETMIKFNGFGKDDSSVIPKMTITYRDMKGYESYWSYISQSAGVGGTGQVNLATGNLLFNIGTLTTIESIFGFTPQLIYDSALAGESYNYPNAQLGYYSSYVANGFKVNFTETIIKKSYLKENYESMTCYIYSDSDGTEHYFMPAEGEEDIYYDEDGLQLKLTTNILLEDSSTQTYCKITYSDFTEKIFKFNNGTLTNETEGVWYLSEIKDIYGNSLKFYTDGSKKVNDIKLTPSGTIHTITMISHLYNANGKLTLLWCDSAKEGVLFRHSDTPTGEISANGGIYLREMLYISCESSIGWSNIINSFLGDFDNEMDGVTVGAVVKYDYTESGQLTKITNGLTNQALEYECLANGAIRSIKELTLDENGNEVLGQTIRISYYNSYTEVRSSGKDDIILTGDDLINVYVFDGNGRVITAYSTNAGRDEIYGVSVGTYEDAEKAKNSLKSSYVLGSPSSNYLLNGGFENAENHLKHWQTRGDVSTYSKEDSDQTETSSVRLNLDAQFSQSSIVQKVYLEEGSYTFSVKVKCDDISNITFSMQHNTYGGPVELNSDQCQNEGYVATYTFNVYGTHTTGIDIKLSAINKTEASTYVEIDNVMLSKNSAGTDFSYIENGSFENMFDANGALTTNPYGYWKMDVVANDGTTGSVNVDTDTKKSAYIIQSSNAALGKALKIKGDILSTNMVYQDILLRNDFDSDNSEEQNFVVSALGKSENATQSVHSTFGIYISVYYENETDPENFYIGFNQNTESWQYTTGLFTISADKKLTKVRIACAYTNNTGSAYFDNISITKNNLISSNDNKYYDDGKLKYANVNGIESFYHYNEAGDLIDVFSENQRVHYEYENHIVTSQSNYIFVTDLSSKNYEQILNSKTYSSIQSMVKYEYDEYGLLVKAEAIAMKYTNGGYVEGEKIVTENTYYLGSNCKIFGALKTSKDSLGQITRYIRDEKNGRLLAVIDPDNYGLSYTYDELGTLIMIQPVYYENSRYSVQDDFSSIEYIYNDKRQLEGVISNGTAYTFSYDVFGNQAGMSIGENQIVSQANNAYNGKVNRIEYASGTVILYEYDELERVSKIIYQNGENQKVYTYEYDANGNLASVQDPSNHIETNYQYDSMGKLIGYIEKNKTNNNINIFTSYSYDAQHRLIRAYYNTSYLEGEDYADLYSRYRYTYDNKGNYKTNSIDFLDEIGNYMLYYKHDELGRLTEKETIIRDVERINGVQTVGNIVNNVVELSYLTNESNTTLLIEEFVSSIELNDVSLSQTTYKYEYDALGNIVSVKNALNEVILSYEYDILGQLTRENNSYTGKTYTYSYDKNGNILSVSEYAYTQDAQITTEPVSTSTYTYGNEDWKDQLTEYNGQQITYDEVGNPLSYLGYTFTWENARDLVAITGNGLTASYTYNSGGIRIGKTVNGIEHKYMLEGTKIVFEFYEDIILVYFYDEADAPIGMAYRNADTVDENATGAEQFKTYLFTKNLQGDIVGIYDENATLVASYAYDAWGNHTVTNYTSDNIGNINPFRYRGYYFDSETGFYYLNTRYYNPQLKRFINSELLNDDLNISLEKEASVSNSYQTNNNSNIASFVKIENPNEIIIELEYQLFFEWNRSPEHEFFIITSSAIKIASLEYSVFTWGAQFGEDKQHTIYNSNLNIYVFAGFDLKKKKYGFEIGGSVGSIEYSGKYGGISIDFLVAKAVFSYTDGEFKPDFGFGWFDFGVTINIEAIRNDIKKLVTRKE